MIDKIDVFLSRGDNEYRVGELTKSQRRIRFEWDLDFKNGKYGNFDISPVVMKINNPDEVVYGPNDTNKGLHGIFADSLPDGWGQSLMDRFFESNNIRRQNINPIDRLSYIGERAMGALIYRPSSGSDADISDEIDLSKLAAEANEIYEGRSNEVLKELRLAGGSPGGARPKVLVGVSDDKMVHGYRDIPERFDHWLIKFNPKNTDTGIKSEGPIELVYAEMAKKSGINMPETRLFELSDNERYFGVRRFDRDKNQRNHVATVAGLLNADFRVPNFEYDQLLKLTRYLTNDQRQVDSVYRQMLFNVRMSVKDDHTKNFSFIMSESGQWDLSPAYDLAPSLGLGGYHTMSILGEGKDFTNKTLVEIGIMHGLPKNKIKEISDEVNYGISLWPTLCNEYDIDREDREIIESLVKSGSPSKE